MSVFMYASALEDLILSRGGWSCDWHKLVDR